MEIKQEKIQSFSETITDAIQAANKMVEKLNMSGCNTDSIKSLNNAASAYKQITGCKIDAEMALWLDTLAENLPSGVIDYIRDIYGNKDAYNTGKI